MVRGTPLLNRATLNYFKSNGKNKIKKQECKEKYSTLYLAITILTRPTVKWNNLKIWIQLLSMIK